MWGDLLCVDGVPSSPGAAGCMGLSQRVISLRGWGFHTVQGSVDPGNRGFCPRVVEVVYVRKGSDPGMGP